MTDLSFMYKCGKCSRNFATPDELKNHTIPCRGTHPPEAFVPMRSHRATKDLAERSPELGLSTSTEVSKRASYE